MKCRRFDGFGQSIFEGHQTVPYEPGSVVVFPTHFNLNNSLLKLLQISLLIR